jgi:hypothetical protein
VKCKYRREMSDPWSFTEDCDITSTSEFVRWREEKQSASTPVREFADVLPSKASRQLEV